MKAKMCLISFRKIKHIDVFTMELPVHYKLHVYFNKNFVAILKK